MQKFIITLSALAFLSGCSVQSETWVSKAGRVEVKEDHFTDTFETAKMNKGMIHAVGDYYNRFGNGPMNIVVSFDPQSKTNTLPLAEKSLGAIRGGLSKWRYIDNIDFISRHDSVRPQRLWIDARV